MDEIHMQMNIYACLIAGENRTENTLLSTFCIQKAEICLLAACAKKVHNNT